MVANFTDPDQHRHSPCQLPSYKVNNGMVAIYLPAQLEAISFNVLVQSRFTPQMTEYAPLTTVSAHKHFEALCYMVTFSLHRNLLM